MPLPNAEAGKPSLCAIKKSNNNSQCQNGNLRVLLRQGDDFETMRVFSVKRENCGKSEENCRNFSCSIIVKSRRRCVLVLSGKQWAQKRRKRFLFSWQTATTILLICNTYSTLFSSIVFSYTLVHCNVISSHPLRPQNSHFDDSLSMSSLCWCIKCFAFHISNGFFIMIYSSNARSVVVARYSLSFLIHNAP